MKEVLLSWEDVTLRDAGGTLFPHIHFSICKGEHWALTGDNEPLQTALLAALAGKTPVIKGKTTYPFFQKWKTENNIPDHWHTPQQCIQFVALRHSFRNLSNTPDFYYQQRFNSMDAENAQTVADYLAAIDTTLTTPAWGFEKVVQELNITPLLTKTLIKLSNGETKRVLLAAALLHRPQMLVLQSPLAGLDAAARIAITALINTIAHSGISIILSTSPDEIPEAITHVATVNSTGITTVLKKDFHAPAKDLHQHAIDTALLKGLLIQQPPFRTIVQMNNVSIRYGNALILNNINWTVRQGERWALTGPNGSGKSTLISLINGDNPQAFAHDIVLFDRKKGSGESIWDIKKKTGFFSPELYQYFPVETSCLQAVESGFYDTMGLFRPSHPQLITISQSWMRLLDVESVASKLLRHASPMQQRLCLLARALVKSPPLLLLDEPCQGFEENHRSYFTQLIDAICHMSNVTLIYVSHYEEALPTCITHRLRLCNGMHVAEGK